MNSQNILQQINAEAKFIENSIGYQKTKIGTIPKDWKVKKLKDISNRVQRKNDGKSHNVLTISSKGGFLNQTERFSKVIAGENLAKYILLRKNEFAYNKGNSKTYPYGCIYRLEDYEEVLVPNVYYCFEIREGVTEFYKHYFIAGKLNKFLARVINTGVRNDGLLNLNVTDFFDVPVAAPPIKEQQKIASILSTWDKAIELKEKLIEQKKQQKKGLMQKLLTGEVRLPGFKDKWKTMLMSNCIDIMNGFPFKSEYFNEENIGIPLIRVRDIKAKEITTYYSGEFSNDYIIKRGDVIVGMDGEFNVTMWDKSEGLLNQRVMKIIPKVGYDLYFIYQLLIPKLKKIEQLTPSTTVKHLSNKDVYGLKVKMPSFDEQKAIGKVLLCSDKEISLLESELEILKKQKKGLMQLLLTGKVRVKV
ncbi:restriction endonuclease subunit S [Bacillus smithii]|uniref:restriction endonuclease subunit S n=1 Tax=Bacillus smithii TaxID=1479 RepID=UPI002E1B2CAB|nr:restriction endonuclease subunit S [Bacillus smithii]